MDGNVVFMLSKANQLDDTNINLTSYNLLLPVVK